MKAILTCSCLADYLEAAQMKCNTNYPVITVDSSFHESPEKMKEEIRRILSEQPEMPETIMIATGFCGGVWDRVSYPCRLVLPKVDDCVTMMLTTDEEAKLNRKESGHLYIYEKNLKDSLGIKLFDDLLAGKMPTGIRGGIMGNGKRKLKIPKGFDMSIILHMFFDSYRSVDVIETEINNCHSEEYTKECQRCAYAINVDLAYVKGSNLILEKLVSGRWDEQFIVIEPEQSINYEDYLE